MVTVEATEEAEAEEEATVVWAGEHYMEHIFVAEARFTFTSFDINFAAP